MYPMFDANFLITKRIKAIIKRKHLLKSLLICIDFNVTFKKFSGVDSPGTPSKDRPFAGRRALYARFVKTQQHPSPSNFSKSATAAMYIRGHRKTPKKHTPLVQSNFKIMLFLLL